MIYYVLAAAVAVLPALYFFLHGRAMQRHLFDAMREQADHERSHQVPYGHDQRVRAIAQRVERKLAKSPLHVPAKVKAHSKRIVRGDGA